MEVANTAGVQKSKEKEWEGADTNGFGRPQQLLRGLALVLTLTAAILLGLDRQTKIIPVTIFPNLPAFNVPVIAKFSDVSAFVYFMVANSVASVFAAASLVLTFASNNGGGKGVSRLMIMVADLIMVALLFSSIGATGAIGIIGFKGNSHLQWNKVCNEYGKFCHQVIASVTLSFVGALLYFLLVILTASKLQKKT